MGALTERFATIDGRRMRYLTGGSGKPLVLCHGFLSSGEEFGGRFAALTESRTVISPDLPGNGQSDPLPGRHTAEAMGAGVLDLLDHLKIDRFDLGGLCLGASAAAAMASARPDAVDNLILHTPLVAPSLVRLRFRWQVHVLTSAPIWHQIVWLARRRVVSDIYKRFLIEGKDVDRATSDINFRNQQRADPRAAKEWLNDALVREDMALIVDRSRPTLIIVPLHDRLVNVERLRVMVQPLANVELFVDDLGGHGWSPDAVKRHLEVMRGMLAGAG